MTSPSRRKRRTTRRNTNPRNLTSAVVVALGCWVALAGGLGRAGELQWRPARIAATPAVQPTAPAVQTVVQVAAWEEADQSAAAPAAVESPRSVVVRREGERVAQAGDPFDPFDAEMPPTEPVAPSAAPQPEYDPFDDPSTEEAAPPQADPNSFPAPSLEEAFEEPAVEQPSIDATPADEPAVEEESTTAEELEQAKQAIDREMQRRETERGLDEELAAPDADAEIEAAPPVLEEQSEMTEELVVPTEPDAESEQSLTEEAGETEAYQLPESNDGELQYGGEVEPLPPPTPEQLERRRQEIEQERLDALAKCETLYAAVRADSIKDISLDIRQQGTPGEDFPFECEGRRPPFQPRNWSPVTYMWKASGLCNKPLYFEQVQLERYGHDWGPVLQPFVSGAHFFGTIPILPYKMGLQPPNECDYSLGYYRPGSCAPYMIEPLGFTWRAAAFQAGAVTGAAFAIP